MEDEEKCPPLAAWVEERNTCGNCKYSLDFDLPENICPQCGCHLYIHLKKLNLERIRFIPLPKDLVEENIDVTINALKKLKAKKPKLKSKGIIPRKKKKVKKISETRGKFSIQSGKFCGNCGSEVGHDLSWCGSCKMRYNQYGVSE